MKGKEFTVTYKEWFKLDAVYTDWVGEKEGSGMKAYEFFTELKKRNVEVTLEKDSYVTFERTQGKTRTQNIMILKVRKGTYPFYECKGQEKYTGFGVTFSPFEIESYK